MEVSTKQLASIFARLHTLQQVADFLQLTPQDLEKPSCGEYIITRIKNYETAARVARELASKKDLPAQETIV